MAHMGDLGTTAVGCTVERLGSHTEHGRYCATRGSWTVWTREQPRLSLSPQPWSPSLTQAGAAAALRAPWGPVEGEAEVVPRVHGRGKPVLMGASKSERTWTGSHPAQQGSERCAAPSTAFALCPGAQSRLLEPREPSTHQPACVHLP